MLFRSCKMDGLKMAGQIVGAGRLRPGMAWRVGTNLGSRAEAPRRGENGDEALRSGRGSGPERRLASGGPKESFGGAAGDWGRIGASNVTRAQAVSIFETGRFHLRDRIGAR